VRAAIYACMSTDKQSADSPADQIARCRDALRRLGRGAAHAGALFGQQTYTATGGSKASPTFRPTRNSRLRAKRSPGVVLVAGERTRAPAEGRAAA
jgi:hypothetical protein